MRPALFAVLLLLLPSVILCLGDGDPVDWNDNAYMVKIVSTVKESEEDKHYGCTGVLLTSSLVLTSSKCFQNTKDDDKMGAVVISIRGNGTRTWKREADVEVLEDYALLTVHRKHVDPCLSASEKPRFERLPLSDDMFKPMWTAPDADNLRSKNCRLVGFETAHADNYTTSNNLLQSAVVVEHDVDGTVMTLMEKGKGPCYDDYGIPLECELKEGEWTLVGMVQAMTREAPREEETPADFCNMINGARFSLLNDPKLNDLMKPHFSKIVAVQKKCFSEKSETSDEKDDE